MFAGVASARVLSDAERPLLEKSSSQADEHKDTHTVTTLLKYSAADTPLLLCAFAAGNFSHAYAHPGF